MKRSIPFTSAALLIAACASTPVAVPDALRPAANEARVMTVGARGVQIYECRARKDGSGPEWAHVAPEAELLDAQGKAIGRHGAGPYWLSTDGSRVVSTVKARADAPAPDAVPWLLLSTTSNGPSGAFSNVTSVQRVNTIGGVAPAMPCTDAFKGTSARVPYMADYIFFTSR